MRLELSRRAEADLADIRDYSVEQFGMARAISYLDAIEQSFRRLLAFPEIGGLHAALTPPIRSLRCQRHRVFYTVDGEVILVQRILHSAMDPARHL